MKPRGRHGTTAQCGCMATDGTHLRRGLARLWSGLLPPHKLQKLVRPAAAACGLDVVRPRTALGSASAFSRIGDGERVPLRP